MSIYRITARHPSGDGPDLKFRVDKDVFQKYGDGKYDWKYSFSSADKKTRIASTPYAEDDVLRKRLGIKDGPAYLIRLIMNAKSGDRTYRMDSESRDLRRECCTLSKSNGPAKPRKATPEKRRAIAGANGHPSSTVLGSVTQVIRFVADVGLKSREFNTRKEAVDYLNDHI